MLNHPYTGAFLIGSSYCARDVIRRKLTEFYFSNLDSVLLNS